MDDNIQVVLKLKKKLNDAVEQKREDNYIVKVIQRLAQVPMTIEILQSTQIGKDVNGLRKISSRVKTESKALVQKWKRLLPPAEPDHPPQPHHDSPKSKQQHRPTSMEHTHTQNSTTGRNEVTTLSVPKPCKSKSRDRAKSSKESLDGFSKALLGMPEVQSSEKLLHCLSDDFPSTLTNESSSHRVAHKPKTKDSLGVTLSPKQRSVSPRPSEVSDSHSRGSSPSMLQSTGSLLRDSPQSNSRKRKADVVGGMDAVALSKRSRTQVYSGKKAVSGPQHVTSLFDLCIKVLTDNIDVIEEVGGIPFYVLEPVLSKCTASQLMRLEEYNPHFTEDSDGLWEKHCRKEFKGIGPKQDLTWKELYIDKLEDRERKLRNLTARISATEKARQEPIRKVMSTVATRPPGRRGMKSTPFLSGRPTSSMEHKSKARPLMKQTMKMAQQRNHMMRFKPSQR